MERIKTRHDPGHGKRPLRKLPGKRRHSTNGSPAGDGFLIPRSERPPRFRGNERWRPWAPINEMPRGQQNTKGKSAASSVAESCFVHPSPRPIFLRNYNMKKRKTSFRWYAAQLGVKKKGHHEGAHQLEWTRIWGRTPPVIHLPVKPPTPVCVRRLKSPTPPQLGSCPSTLPDSAISLPSLLEPASTNPPMERVLEQDPRTLSLRMLPGAPMIRSLPPGRGHPVP